MAEPGRPDGLKHHIVVSDLNNSPDAKAERALSIADNYMTTVENRIAQLNISDTVADVARFEAATASWHIFNRVKFDHIENMFRATLPENMNVDAKDRNDFFTKIGDKIANMQFAMRLTPDAKPAGKLTTAEDMLDDYRFQLTCRIAEGLLPQHPDIVEWLETRDPPDIFKVIETYEKNHGDAPEYLYSLIEIAVSIRGIAAFSETSPPLAEKSRSRIRYQEHPFIDKVTRELSEPEQKALSQVLDYGDDLQFGRGGFFDHLVTSLIEEDR